MQENKPTSLAITVVILLCMLHVTVVVSLFTVVLMLIGWHNYFDVFYYLIDYTLLITFLVTFVNSVRIEDNIFVKKQTKWASDDDDNIIVSASTISLIITFVVVLIVNVFKNISPDIGIFILHVIVFGGVATYFVTLYIITPLFMLINVGISIFTNWVFNTIFTKHLKP